MRFLYSLVDFSQYETLIPQRERATGLVFYNVGILALSEMLILSKGVKRRPLLMLVSVFL